MRDEFKEARSLMKLSFTQLDQQMRSLDLDVSSLKSHVTASNLTKPNSLRPNRPPCAEK